MKSKLLFSLVLVLFMCGCDGEIICKHRKTDELVDRFNGHTFGNWVVNTNLEFTLSYRPVAERTCRYCGVKEYND